MVGSKNIALAHSISFKILFLDYSVLFCSIYNQNLKKKKIKKKD